jgi:hypothetical protein
MSPSRPPQSSVCVPASSTGAGRRHLICVVAALAAGCASVGPPRPQEPAVAPPAAPALPSARPGIPAAVEPPPPPVNLSGFPLSYRQGYADGCRSADGTTYQDTVRYGADGNYRTGWQDGLALCRRK